MAVLNNTLVNVILIPVSHPMSTDMSLKADNDWMFSAWKATIDEAAANDKMTLFVIRSEDIGNPAYTEDFRTLIAYAKNKGLRFTTPDVITNHVKNIQNIEYSGLLQGDMATINVTNNNDEMVPQVAFRIILPALKEGNYSARGGTITTTKADKGKMIVYASTDIPAHTSKEITIEPDTARLKIVVTQPRRAGRGKNYDFHQRHIWKSLKKRRSDH